MEHDKIRWEIPVVIPSYEPDEKLIDLLSRLRETGFQNLVLVEAGRHTIIFSGGPGRISARGCFVML